MSPWDGLEGNLNASLGRLGPGSVLTTDVLRSTALVVVLGDSKNITETLLDEFDILSVVLDTGSDDKALLGGDVVHDELLEYAGVQVVNVASHTKAGHAECVESISGSKEEFLVISAGVEFDEVIVEVVRLDVLRLGNVGGEDGAGFKSNINHHLEHINGVVLDAVTLEVHGFLIVVHLHVTARHLDHTVVDGLIGVLEGFEVSVLESEEGAGGLF